MNIYEYLLAKLIEEAVEVGQRGTKALTFSLHEVQPGQQLDNARRLEGELVDLLALWEMCAKQGLICTPQEALTRREAIERKKAKVISFVPLSIEMEALQGNPVAILQRLSPKQVCLECGDRLTKGGHLCQRCGLVHCDKCTKITKVRGVTLCLRCETPEDDTEPLTETSR